MSLAMLAGCTTFERAPKDRLPAAMLAVAPADWPERDTRKLATLTIEEPRAITELVPDGSRPVTDIPPDLRERLTRPLGKITYAGMHGMGLLRVVESGRAPSGGTSTTDRSSLSRSNSFRFVSFSPVDDRPADSRIAGWIRRMSEARNAQLGSRNVGVKATDPELLSWLYEGTSVRLRPPAGGATPRGLIVHMQGLGSAEYEQPLLDELQRRGWYVLRVATPRVWWFEEKKYPITSRAEVPSVAQRLARHLDDLVAEPAYAAEAAVDFLRTHRPEVPIRPMVMVGCSAGALAAPAVVARMQSDFDAAVLVGGGVNLLEISQTSDLTTGGIRLQWPDNLAKPEWRAELFRTYLDASKLDPYHTSQALKDKPVLMVHANLDATVPAENGRRLWERLNRPDRYTHVLGHRLLFFTLPSQSRRIADWIDRAVPARPATASK